MIEKCGCVAFVDLSLVRCNASDLPTFFNHSAIVSLLALKMLSTYIRRLALRVMLVFDANCIDTLLGDVVRCGRCIRFCRALSLYRAL